MQIETNKEEFSAECHSVDCSGDSKVLTELQIAIRSRLLFSTTKSQENWEEFERRVWLFIWTIERYCKYRPILEVTSHHVTLQTGGQPCVCFDNIAVKGTGTRGFLSRYFAGLKQEEILQRAIRCKVKRHKRTRSLWDLSKWMARWLRFVAKRDIHSSRNVPSV